MGTTVILLTEGEPQLAGSEQVKHTPGPWGVEFCSVAQRFHIEAGAWPFGTSVCELNGNKNDEGNARLIAAAPDMLAALKAIRDGLADTKSTPGQRMTLITKADAHELARVAIAKAGGAP